MGSDKTAVGQRLGAKSGIEHVDLDRVLAREYGPIAGWFPTEGEAWFRNREYAALRHAIARPGRRVISLGGGTLTHPASLRLLQELEAVSEIACVTLRADVDDVLSRISGDTGRPLLETGNKEAEARRLLLPRDYSMFPTVSTSGTSIRGAAGAVEDLLGTARTLVGQAAA